MSKPLKYKNLPEVELYHKKLQAIRWAEFLRICAKLLVLITILSSWGEWIYLAQITGLDASDSIIEPASRPALYYILHGLSIAAALAAGFFYAIDGQFKKLSSGSRLAVIVLMTTSLTWALVSYTFNDFLNWSALGATGPLVWLTTIFIFAGMDQSVWKYIDPLIRILSYITAVLALAAILNSRGLVIERFFSAYVRYMILLMWFGGWTYLTNIPQFFSTKFYLRFLPFIAFVLSTIFTQTRSWFITSFLLLFSYLFVNSRSTRLRMQLTMKLWIGLLVVILLMSAGYLLKSPLNNAFIALTERTLDDSRTGQYIDFFNDVSPSELILGRGPKGSWYWPGVGSYHFIDNPYLWMAFIGGLPTLISYFVLIILPGIRAWKRGARDNDAAAAVLVILWGLACTGFSTFTLPSLTPYAFVISLYAGRCHNYIKQAEAAGFHGARTVATA